MTPLGAEIAAFGGWPAALGGWAAALAVALGARAVLARRSEKIARACHELRGPITAARLGLELCSRRGELPPVTFGALELELERATLALEDLRGPGRVRGSGRRRIRGSLRHRIRGSGLRAGSAAACASDRHDGPGCNEIDVPDLLARSVEAWRAAALACGAELVMGPVAGEVVVRGDRLRLAQATGNLIANAIEHGGGTVEVRGRPHGAGVRLEITDEGPGLPAPVAELARRPRAGRGDRGRGLAIAAAIAADHGGRLAAAPTERGARLVLDLPAAGPQRPRRRWGGVGRRR
jgi:signal transduction histidine kinase